MLNIRLDYHADRQTIYISYPGFGHDWILSSSDAHMSGYNLNIGLSFVL